MTIAHLTASPFFGGPERQLLGLATQLPPSHRCVFLLYQEGGRCRPFLSQLAQHGIETRLLDSNTPHLLASAGEVATQLREMHADVLCCHGYKPDIVGCLAARQAGVPAVAVSRGWTCATGKVRLYEMLDRVVLCGMDAVACVSAAQAAKVRAAGVSAERIHVVRNAIDVDRFTDSDPQDRATLERFFADPPQSIVLSAGRLSPEKGFGLLVEAAARVVRSEPSAGFVVFGDGPLRPGLRRRIAALGLQRRFVLAGFRSDLDRLIPHADVLALPSFTEGLPNVVLEAMAAGVAVVATAVGGVPEAVADGISGYLVPPGQPGPLADRLLSLLRDPSLRQAMGARGRRCAGEQFTFQAQAAAYQRLFGHLLTRHDRHRHLLDLPRLRRLDLSGLPRPDGDPGAAAPPAAALHRPAPALG